MIFLGLLIGPQPRVSRLAVGQSTNLLIVLLVTLPRGQSFCKRLRHYAVAASCTPDYGQWKF
uniref:Uncharacterized protein n=1 Tax=Solanum tuberosum TaxID=4113 RepID=M0ZZK0_SOLTU